MGSGLALPAGDRQGHLIIYRAESDSRTNRANLALLRRIVLKSTTPVACEVYYHENTRLLTWAEREERIRFVRLRSGEPFPLAERIAVSPSAAIVVLDDSLLYSAADVWLLMAHARSSALACLAVSRAVRERTENRVRYFMREARLTLSRYLLPQGEFSAHAFALNKTLWGARAGSFAEKQAYSDLVRAKTTTTPLIVRGGSVAVRPSGGVTLLAAGFRTADAFLAWKRSKHFPWWFGPRLPLFHVAQFAAYYGALVLMISPLSALLVFAFAIAITPQFFLARLTSMRPLSVPARLTARFLMYFVG